MYKIARGKKEWTKEKNKNKIDKISEFGRIEKHGTVQHSNTLVQIHRIASTPVHNRDNVPLRYEYTFWNSILVCQSIVDLIKSTYTKCNLDDDDDGD